MATCSCYVFLCMLLHMLHHSSSMKCSALAEHPGAGHLLTQSSQGEPRIYARVLHLRAYWLIFSEGCAGLCFIFRECILFIHCGLYFPFACNLFSFFSSSILQSNLLILSTCCLSSGIKGRALVLYYVLVRKLNIMGCLISGDSWNIAVIEITNNITNSGCLSSERVFQLSWKDHKQPWMHLKKPCPHETEQTPWFIWRWW